jgi:hypothetical protein
MKKNLIVALLAIATPVAALADTAVCQGKITTIGNHANGLAFAIGTGNMIRVCSFTAAQFGVSVEDCKHMASIAALAFASDANVVLYVDNAPTTACSSVPGWHISQSRYLGVEK